MKILASLLSAPLLALGFLLLGLCYRMHDGRYAWRVAPEVEE